MSKTRCKFRCSSVTKSLGYGGSPFIYAAKFGVVYGDSPENKAFFVATPQGEISVSTVREDSFVVGSDYYVDFTPVPAPGESP